jgi:hypothetical protein
VLDQLRGCELTLSTVLHTRTSQAWQVAAAGALAALPVVVSVVNALAVGWVPLGDDAVIAIRSYDVFSPHSPLLGQYSASSVLVDTPTYSLGPLLYWLLAIPVRIGPEAMVLVVGAVNVAAMVGCVAIARRLAGPWLMMATAVALAVMCRSLDGRTFSDIWNPAVGLLPFTLLIFLALAIAAGELRLLPVAVLVASFVTQCHLMYLLPSVALLAVAGVAVVAGRRRSADPPPLRRVLLISAAVALVCWSAPLLDQVTNRPGNLWTVVRAAVENDERIGATAGWNALTHAIALPPTWVSGSATNQERVLAQTESESALGVATALLVLAGLGVVLAAALRRRRIALAAAAAQALLLCLALFVVTASTPEEPLLAISVGYTLWLATPVSMFAYLTLGWGAVSLAGPALRSRLELRPVRTPLAVAGAVVAIASVVAAGTGPDHLEPEYEPARELEGGLETLAEDADVVRVEVGGGSVGFTQRFDLQTYSAFALRRAGAHPIAPNLEASLGDWYAESDGSEAAVRVANAGDALPPGARQLGELALPAGGGSVVVAAIPPGMRPRLR